MPEPKPTKTQEALERLRELHGRLTMIGARKLEEVIDRKAGLIFQRWYLPNGTNVVTRASSEGADAFLESTPFVNSWQATFDKLDELSRLERPAVPS